MRKVLRAVVPTLSITLVALVAGTSSSTPPKPVAHQALVTDVALERLNPERASRAKSEDVDAFVSTTTTSTEPPPTTSSSVPRIKKSPPSTQPVRSTVSASTGDIWSKLAYCESTMNQRATSKDGLYLGYFQFSRATWASVGGPGDPRDQDYSTQLKYAQILQARSGWGQWPNCSRKLGLR